jgi:hypothetical protein
MNTQVNIFDRNFSISTWRGGSSDADQPMSECVTPKIKYKLHEYTLSDFDTCFELIEKYNSKKATPKKRIVPLRSTLNLNQPPKQRRVRNATSADHS